MSMPRTDPSAALSSAMSPSPPSPPPPIALPPAAPAAVAAAPVPEAANCATNDADPANAADADAAARHHDSFAGVGGNRAGRTAVAFADDVERPPPSVPGLAGDGAAVRVRGGVAPRPPAGDDDDDAVDVEDAATASSSTRDAAEEDRSRGVVLAARRDVNDHGQQDQCATDGVLAICQSNGDGGEEGGCPDRATTITAGGCGGEISGREDYDALVEEASLLNNFFSSAAPSSDDARADDRSHGERRDDGVGDDAEGGSGAGRVGKSECEVPREDGPRDDVPAGDGFGSCGVANAAAKEEEGTRSINSVALEKSVEEQTGEGTVSEGEVPTRKMESGEIRGAEAQSPPYNAESKSTSDNAPHADKAESGSPSDFVPHPGKTSSFSQQSNVYPPATTSQQRAWKSADEIRSGGSFASSDSATLTSSSSSSGGEESPTATVRQGPCHHPAAAAAARAPPQSAAPGGEEKEKKRRKDRTGHPKLNQVAVEYLRAWMMSRQHVEQPYPTDYVYAQLGAATGLEKNQLKNWFVNNRRRLWKPMMTELRRRHGLSDRDPLPARVLDTLEDEPRPPYPPHVYRPAPVGSFLPPPAGRLPPPALRPLPSDAPISAAADSVAAVAMIMMTGGGSRVGGRADSPTTGDPKDVAAAEDRALESVRSGDSASTTPSSAGGGRPGPGDQSPREVETQRGPRALLPRVHVPPKEQVKFNVGGTVVQVPTDILLKHPESKIASMARSAMRVAGVAIPIPRDYELFSLCVFYLCNGRVNLPPGVRRKPFLREMKHFGIPYEAGSVSGGCASPGPANATNAADKSNLEAQREQISPTTVTQLHGAGAPAQPRPVPHPMPSAGSFQQEAGMTMTNGQSPLDLLSSVSSTSTWTSGFVEVRNPAALKQQQRTTSNTPPPLKRSNCGNCEACLLENCGECRACLDKPQFGGPNRLRKKCARRKCPHMAPHSFVVGPAARPAAVALAAQRPRGGAAVGRLERSPIEERRTAGPNLAVLAAERRWSENLAALRPCIEPGGLINYPAIEDEDARNRVKNFVKEQRKSFRRRENGEATSLTDERLKLLKEANFPFVFKPHTKTSKPAPAEELAKKPTSSLDLLISITSQSIASDIGVVEEDPAKKPTSSLDLLCSITAQSFDQADSWCEDTVDDQEAEGVSRSPTPTASAPPAADEVAESAKPKVLRARGPNCGQCEACVRDDCGKCKACLDKPKFGGPNTMKRRCFNRYCLSRKEEERPPQERRGNEEAIMKAELEKIKAELDARAEGVEYGFKVEGAPERRSSRTIENSMGSIGESDNDEGVAESCAEEDEAGEDANATHESARSNKLSDAVHKTATATNMLELPRGVTVRPSGKWQVQLYYAGNSRYIGLFDTKEEAAKAYEMARECCNSFQEDNPTPEQVKMNLDLMRKAAFSGVDFGRYSPEESKLDDQPKEIIGTTIKDKPDRSSAVPVKHAKDDDTGMELAKAELHAVTKRPASGSINAVEKKRPGRAKSGRAIEKSQKTKRQVEDCMADKAAEHTESRKRKFSSVIYQKAKALAESLPRGITVRPSGKWQVQLYYAGKSRYIGVFNSKLDAAVAYELARDCFVSFKDDDISPEQAKKNVELMRKAAFSFAHNNTKRQRANAAKDSPVAANGDKLKKRSAPMAEQQRAERPTERARKLDDKKLDPKKKPEPKKKVDPKKSKVESKLDAKANIIERPPKGGTKRKSKHFLPQIKQAALIKQASPTKRTAPAAVTIVAKTPASRRPIAKELPEIGPGWKLNIIPRSSGQGSDYYYFSPTGKCFRSYKEAEEASANNERITQEKDEALSVSGQVPSADFDRESNSVNGLSSTGIIGTCIGAVGYKFRKKIADEDGKDVGWYDGEVVDILGGEDKDRKCVYAADGYIENLSLDELEVLAELESKSHANEQLGSVGWKFQKQFDDGKWYAGVVAKILVNADNGYDRRCHYPANDGFEDLSIADLRILAQLEKKKGKKEKTEKEQHNDLCETCGDVGRLLCCSTCNLVFHLGCARPKLTELPVDDWSCAFCAASGGVGKKISKQEQQQARLAVQEIEAMKEELRKKEELRRKSPRKRKKRLNSNVGASD